MIFELLYAGFWIFLIFFGVRSTYVFKNNIHLNSLTSYGFLIKSIATIALFIVYEKLAPNSNLFIDSDAYMKDTIILNNVFYSSPISYFKFLTGFGETNKLVLTYLSDTFLWDKGQSLYNDSKNVVRFNSLIYFISQGNIYVHVVFMSLFSTLGIRLIVVAFKRFIEAYKTLFFILLFLIPSVFISTGGVLKEPLLILGIGLFINAILSENSNKLKWIALILGVLLLLTIKPYTFLVILLGISFFFFAKYIFASKPWMSLLLFFFLSAIFFFSIKPLRASMIESISKKQLDMERIAKGGLYIYNGSEKPKIMYFRLEEIDKLLIEKDYVQIIAPVSVEISTENQWEDFKKIKMQPSSKKWKVYALFPSSANSFFKTIPIRNSVSAFIFAIPEAFFNGLLRPFPSDSGSAYKYPAMLEVYFCLGMFVFALFNRKKTTIFEKRIVGSLIVFIVISLILIGLTTPVIGALVRYRISAYIGIIVLTFIILKIPEKWKNRIQ